MANALQQAEVVADNEFVSEDQRRAADQVRTVKERRSKRSICSGKTSFRRRLRIRRGGLHWKRLWRRLRRKSGPWSSRIAVWRFPGNTAGRPEIEFALAGGF